MIQFKQSLRLNRLVVLKSGGSLYDERFHLGVNIIRGKDNSVGKSTIADFIFYSLGGEVVDWTSEAGSADSAHVECSIGGRVHTLSREVEPGGHAPMYFFEGVMEEAMANRSAWLKYPFSRTVNTDSFSQVLFRLLHLPEQKTDAQQNITMHQILRLLYCDQMTPVDQIFRQERKFDTRDIRVAIAELLLGFDDLALHDLRLEIRNTDRAYGVMVGELTSIFKVLGKTSDSGVAFDDLQKELQQLQGERKAMEASVELLSTSRDRAARKDAGGRLEELAKSLRSVSEDLSRNRAREQVLTLDMEDSRRFIETLKDRVSAIDASKGMADLLGSAKFTLCPACLSPLDSKGSNGECHLCKNHLPDTGKWGHLKMREELAFQIRESTQLLDKKNSELVRVREALQKLSAEYRRLQSDLGEFERRIDPVDAEISSQLRRIGYIDRSIEDVARRAELAALVQKKMDERSELENKLSKLRSNLEARENQRQQRRNDVTYRIVELCINALRHDLDVEEAFRDAELVQFDFGQNKIAVNGRTKFSASSATYLKNAFLFSLFELSLQDEEVRWPRFILLDNIEDKGMQPARSANFQEYVVDRSGQYDVEYQVIMTTSMISPRLQDSALCIGPDYTKHFKTLRFATPSSNGPGVDR